MKDKPLNNRQLAALRAKNAQKASNLLTRLEKNANGELENQNKEPVEMTSGQLKAAELFLKKTMPDLQSVDSTTTIIDQKSGEEIQSEAVSFLMKATGMGEEEARHRVMQMAKEAMQ